MSATARLLSPFLTLLRLNVFFLFLLTAQNSVAQQTSESRELVVGSKNFNENYLLAEVIAQLFETQGYVVDRQFGIVGTLTIYEALRTAEVDVYVEYTGTLAEAILDYDGDPTLSNLNTQLASTGLEILPSIGFNNSYALTMKREAAAERGIETISDLLAHQDLNFGFSLEFLNRDDGWLGLVQNYGFQLTPSGMDHGLAYQAIDEGAIDITDAYTTDGDLERYGLTILEDDRNLFPKYFAVPFINSAMGAEARRLLGTLSGRIDEARMRDLNAGVILQGKSFAVVASEFLLAEGMIQESDVINSGTSLWSSLWRNTLVHLQLTFIALGLGCLVGLPAGILIYRSKRLSRVLLYGAGLLQTVPSIALLALLIPFVGIGQTPAIIALFLYSLLPILRSTVTALLTIDPVLKRVAETLGMTRMQQLREVLLPLALPNVLTGVKTAAIISIGTATLAAFIGAGGLGEPIVSGLALNDTSLILQGAIPAACLAIITEIFFEQLEKRLVKPHMLVGQLPT